MNTDVARDRTGCGASPRTPSAAGGRRPRWLALTLVALCVGALLHPAPSVTPVPDGGARLVLQGSSAAAALPSSTLVEVAEFGDSTTPPFQRLGDASLARTRDFAGPHLLRGPSHPKLARRRTGAGLLGLHATPANAPPRA